MRLWVWIPPEAWMSVCCVLSGRGLCNKLITLLEESYRLWCVFVCYLETSWMRRPWPTGGCRANNKQFWIYLMSLHKLANSQTSLSSPLFKLSPRIEVRNVTGYKIKVFIFLENLTCVLLSAQYIVCKAGVIPQTPHHFIWNFQCTCHKPLSQHIITAAMYQRPSVYLNPPTCRYYVRRQHIFEPLTVPVLMPQRSLWRLAFS